ncbi:hypothetical protein ECO9634_01499, partial [Escherichia coli O111:H8 str. CVM9634]
MTTITREQAQKIIEAADEVISALAGTNEDVHPGSDNMLRLWDDLNDRYAPPEVVRELARIALASLEAEPVAECIVEDGGMCIDGFGEYVGHSLPDGTHQLYTAPPAPVVPEEKPCLNPLSMYAVDAVAAIAEVRGWNACR